MCPQRTSFVEDQTITLLILFTLHPLKPVGTAIGMHINIREVISYVTLMGIYVLNNAAYPKGCGQLTATQYD